MTAHPRTDPPTTADERTSLTAFLDYHRDTLDLKCTGLSDEELRRRATPPSNLSLLGLVRHLAEVERGWFRRRLSAEPVPYLWCTPEHADADFDDVEGADVTEAFTAWRTECDASRAIAAAHDLDATFERRGETLSVRWLLLHMIEEYARHNGHADLLREALDGSIGE